MTPSEEKAYQDGGEWAWTRMLGVVLKELPEGGEHRNLARWQIERAETVLKLRTLAKDLGARWRDDLYLPDNIEHILAALAEKGVL
jgi:hypothetical protein